MCVRVMHRWLVVWLVCASECYVTVWLVRAACGAGVRLEVPRTSAPLRKASESSNVRIGPEQGSEALLPKA